MKDKHLKNLEISRLCHGLSLFLHAGISPMEGLVLLSGEEDGDMREMLTRMADSLDDGKTLSEAMLEEGVFASDVTGMTSVGEKTGRLEESLASLGAYYDSRDKTDKLIRNSLAYPSALMLVILCVIAVMLVKVLPVFDSVYVSLGSQLTGISGALLSIGKVMNQIMPALLFLLFAAVLFLSVFFVSESFRSKLFSLMQKKFSSKGLFYKLNGARFAEALSMALRSGLHDDEAVLLAGELLSDIPYAVKKCDECRALLLKGKSLPAALGESACLPQYACAMLSVGIKAGCSDKVMEEISTRLSSEATEAVEGHIAAIEPVMVSISSVLIGALLLSVMLPLMNIMSAIG